MPPNPTPSRLDALESMRGCAATYVFAHHIVHFYLTNRALKRVFVFGQLSVMLFFVMSGFVIYYSTFGRGRRQGFGDYLLRRFRRIYPLFLIALAVTYLCRCLVVGHPFVPDLSSLAGNLAMLQDHDRPGNWFAPFLDNDPLWSLSYEWTFYLAFFPTVWLLAARPALQKYAVLGISSLAFLAHRLAPNPIAMFLIYYVIWWSGVELAREYLETGRITLRAQFVPMASIAAVAGLWLAALLADPSIRFEKTAPGVIELRHFVTVLASMIVGISWYWLGGRGFGLIFGWGRHMAAMSYAIYIFHTPVLQLFRTGLPRVPALVAVPTMVAIVLGLSYLTEQRLQPLINRWLSPRRAPRRAEEPAPVASL